MTEVLFHQVIAGKKTQTRREGKLKIVNYDPDKWTIMADGRENPGYKMTMVIFSQLIKPSLINIGHNKYVKPTYKVGEVLFLKEPTSIMSGVTIAYKFDSVGLGFEWIKWCNKMFMPTSHARHFIEITNIRCERLFDISDEDCIAEGIETYPSPGGINDLIYKQYGKFDGPAFCLTPKNSFISLFRFANKIPAYKETGNPWVWVYEFKYLPDYKLTINK